MSKINLVDAIEEVEDNIPSLTDRLLQKFHGLTSVEIKKRGLYK